MLEYPPDRATVEATLRGLVARGLLTTERGPYASDDGIAARVPSTEGEAGSGDPLRPKARIGRLGGPSRRDGGATRLAFLYSATGREPPDSLGHVAVARHRIVRQNARKIHVDCDPFDEDDFKALVRSALDELPLEFHRALEHVAVVVSDGGRRRHAYGLYQGDTVARDYFHDRIVIFRDTLLRDFGHDPELLKAQVTRTVRHELAHHLGWDENGVRGLGL